MRRKRNIKREIIPDPKYGNQMIAKFINYVMRKGKKTVAQKVVYKTFDVLEKKYKVDPASISNYPFNITNESGTIDLTPGTVIIVPDGEM